MSPTPPPESPPVEPPPEHFNAAAWLLALNTGRASKLAYIDDRQRLSYAELDARVRRCAAGLLALGLHREQRVLMVMHDSIDFVTAFLGALYAGLVPVPVNTLLTSDDYAFMLEHSAARALLFSSALWPTLQAAATAHPLPAIASGPGEAPPGTRPFAELLDAAPLAAPADTRADDFGFWLYSSGSTGRPKGTVHSHANLYWTAALYAKPVLGLREDDVGFSAAKLFFAYGLGNALTFPMSVGATTVLAAERPTPAAVFKRWIDHRVTVFFGAPTGYAGMLAAPTLPERAQVALRLCSSAGEALPREIGERFSAHFGCEIVDGLGSTEMLHIFLSNRPGDVQYGSTGTVVPGYRLKLVDEAGAEVGPGEIGDLYVAGPSSALMYWGQREKSRATFQGEWTKTGDKYSIDARGCHVYAGRSDDMLKVSGIYVSPFEVEATLMQHPAVLESAVIGVEDADGLTKTKAYVVLKPGATASDDELKAFVKGRLAAYKYPRTIEFIDELPKTATGKIQRFRLRQRSDR
ncbi:MAG TPA: benzoate-CoA ligase family protein [Burkholderiaceae bacterium]|jgi:benzoate-CoA ligase